MDPETLRVLGDIQRMIGANASSLEGIRAMMEERARNADRQFDEMRKELRDMRQDQRTLETTVLGLSDRYDRLKLAVERLSGDVEDRFSEVNKDVAAIRRPMDAMSNSRAKMAGAVMVLAGIGGALWLVVDPLIKWTLDRMVGR